ncbi:transposase [Klebsiella pneumoniae]|nr:transposase [Klebsiella pneumoniae]
MKKTRYTEEQIAFALKQAETGHPRRGSLPKDGHF